MNAYQVFDSRSEEKVVVAAREVDPERVDADTAH
jgi:hypothetical protein